MTRQKDPVNGAEGRRGRLGRRRLLVASMLALTSAGVAVAVPATQAGAAGAPILESWGYNAYGQLGNGTTTNSTTPGPVSLPSGVTATASAAGGNHSLAIGSNGTLYAWGDNGYGQLGNGTTTDSSTPVAVLLPSGVHATEIAAGLNDSMALGSDGSVYEWGDNSLNELGNGSTVANSDTPVVVSIPAGVAVRAIAGGQFHSLALTSTGAVYGWGYDGFGQLGNGVKTTPTTPVLAEFPSGVHATMIAAGGYHSLAEGTDGNVYAWGENADGQLGTGEKNEHLKPTLVLMPAGVSAVALAAGLNHSLAIGTDGKVYAWGDNTYGQLGNGTTTSTTTPVVSSITGTPSSISAGEYFSSALLPNGTIDSWGLNSFGQLGNGTTNNALTPTPVDLPPNAAFSSLASDSMSSHALAIVVPSQSTTVTSLSASVTSPTYGESVTITATVTGSDGGGTVAFLDGANTLSGCGTVSLALVGANYQGTCTTAALTAGHHSLSGSYTGDAGSAPSTSTALPMTVAPAPLSVIASTSAVTYGTAPAPVTASYAGFVNGDGPGVLTSVPTCTTSATSSSPAGNYPTTCAGAAAANYSITYADGEIVVGPAPLSISASSGTMTYGGAPPTITPSYTGFVNGDTAASLTTAPTCTTTAGATSPVGNYPSTCSGAADPNYTISATDGQVVVGAAPLVVTASSAATTYGTAATAITPSYSGFLNGDTASSLTSQPTCTTTANAESGVGTYPATCTGAADPNYDISYVAGSVTVSPAPVTITASSASMTYGGSAPTVTPTVNGLQNGEGASVLGAGLTCTTEATSSSPTGSYPATCSGAADPNYAISYVNGSTTVTPASLTITASSASMNYGDSVPMVTPTVNGLQNGEGVSVLGSGLTCTTEATSSSQTGTYPATCSGAADPNYAISYVDGSTTVSPASLSITASSESLTYGGPIPAVTAQITGLVNGEDASVLGAGLMCSTSAQPGSPVGTYGSVCSGAVDSNYTITYVQGTVTVGPAALVVTASSSPVTYGDSVPQVTASYEGFVNGDNTSSLSSAPTCTTTATSSSAVGSYPTQCTGAVDSNYTITYEPGSVTVDPAALVVTASSSAVTYGDSVPQVTASYSGFVNGDSASTLGSAPTCTTTATSSSAAGSYPTQCTGAVDSNYTITYEPGSVVIGQAPLVIVASSGTSTYGDTPSTVTSSYQGFTAGDTAASLTTPPTCTTTATSSSGVGTYTTSCSGAVDGNYDITYEPGQTIVEPAPLGITASSTSQVYGAASPTISPTYSGLVNGDTASSLATAPTCTSPVLPTTPVGTYASTCSGAVDANYDITYEPGQTLVDPAPLGITASSTSQAYGAAPPYITPTYSGLVNGDTASSLATAPTCTSPVLPTTPVGTYVSECSGASDPNYAITYAAGSVTVGQADVTVTAGSGSTTYGSPAFTVTPSVGGLQNGEDPSVLGSGLTCTSAADSTSPVGSYPSSCTGASDPNYLVTYVDGTVEVTPAAATVTASSGSFTYGSAVPVISPTVTGLVNGETAAVLGSGLACGTSALATTPVGAYPSSCSGGVDGNYQISYVDGVVQEVAAPLVVAASSGTMTYGSTPPAITPTYSGFVNGDEPGVLNSTPVCSTAATSSSPVGTYPSSCSGGSDPDYTLTYVRGDVVVGASTLIVTASSDTRTYGSATAVVTPSYTGFENGDGPSSLTTRPSCSSAGIPTSGVGNYTTSCSGASDPNYVIDYVNGMDSVTPAPLTVTAASTTMTYGGQKPAITATVTGLQNGDTSSVLGTGLSCSTAAGPTSPVGSYSSSCSGASDPNYIITYAGGTVTVGPATLTVTATNLTKEFGSANPSLTYVVSGFVNGQTLATSGVTGQAACTTAATTTSPAGSYPITCAPGTLAAGNYAFAFVPGTLTVTNTTTLACLTIGSVTVSAGQSVRIAPGCTVIGSITVKPGGALDSEGALVLGSLNGTGGTVRMCDSSFALIFTATGATGPIVVGDGTSSCQGSTLIGGVSFTSNTGGVSMEENTALGAISVTHNSGGVTVTGNQVYGSLTVTGNTGVVADHPNTVFGASSLQ